MCLRDSELEGVLLSKCSICDRGLQVKFLCGVAAIDIGDVAGM